MIWIIVRRELLDNLLSLRFALLTLLCLTLIPLSFHVNRRSYEARLSDYNQLVQKYREDLDKTTDIVDIEPKGFRPLSPLSVFVVGLEETMPRYFIAVKDEGVQMGENAAGSDPLGSLFGKLDFLFVVKVILSLVAIVFTFDAIAGEKQSGTLRLALSNSVPRYAVLLGKLLGSLITFLVPFILAWLVGMVLLAASPFPLFVGDNFPRIISMLLLAILYTSVFLNLGLFVSSRASTPMTSIIALLLIWVGMVLVVPKVATVIARIAYPAKSREVLNIEKSLIVRDIEAEKSKLIREEITTDLIGSEEYDKLRAPIAKKLRGKRYSLLRRLIADYERERSIQETIAANIARLSPSTPLDLAMAELAGTGLGELRRFWKAAENYQEIVTREVFDKYWKDVFIGAHGGVRKIMHFVPFQKGSVPAFSLRRQDLSGALKNTRFDLLLLGIFNVLSFMGAYAAFLRYDVR